MGQTGSEQYIIWTRQEYDIGYNLTWKLSFNLYTIEGWIEKPVLFQKENLILDKKWNFL